MNQQQNNFAENLFRKTNKIIEVLGAVDKDSINVGVQSIKNDIEDYNLTYNNKIDNFTKFLNCENTKGNNVSFSYQFDINSGRDLYIVDSGNKLWYFNNGLQKLEACSSGEDQLTLRSTERDTAHFVFNALLYIIDNTNKLYVMGDNKKTFVKIQIGEDANISQYFIYKNSSLYIVDNTIKLYVSTDGQTFEICKFGDGEGDIMTYYEHFIYNNDKLYIVNNTTDKYLYVEGADAKTFNVCKYGASTNKLSYSSHFIYNYNNNNKLYIVDNESDKYLYVEGDDKETFNVCKFGGGSYALTCFKHFESNDKLYIVDKSLTQYLFIVGADEKSFNNCQDNQPTPVSITYSSHFIYNNNKLYIVENSNDKYLYIESPTVGTFVKCLINGTTEQTSCSSYYIFDDVLYIEDNNNYFMIVASSGAGQFSYCDYSDARITVNNKKVFYYDNGTNKYVYCISSGKLLVAPLNTRIFDKCKFGIGASDVMTYSSHFIYNYNNNNKLYIVDNTPNKYLYVSGTDEKTFDVCTYGDESTKITGYSSNFTYNNNLYIINNSNILFVSGTNEKSFIVCKFGTGGGDIMKHSEHFTYDNKLYIVDNTDDKHLYVIAITGTSEFIECVDKSNTQISHSSNFTYNGSLYVADNTSHLLKSTSVFQFDYCTIQGSTSTYPTYKNSFVSGEKLFIINNSDELMRTGYDEEPAPYSKLLVNELQEEEGTSLKALMIQLLANSNTTNALLRELLNEMQSN